MRKKFLRVISLTIIIMLFFQTVSYAYGEITIDGYYDDWDDKPHSEMYHGNNTNVIHNVSFFRDEENAYIHIKMSEHGETQFHNLGILTIETNAGDQSYMVTLQKIQYKGRTIDEDIEEIDTLNNTAESIYSGDSITLTDSTEDKSDKGEGTGKLKVRLKGNGNKVVGSGYYTREQGESDEAEFYIPLSSISSDPDSIKDMELSIPELGKQHIFSVGTSTGTYIGVAVCALIAVTSVGYFEYRRKKKIIKG